MPATWQVAKVRQALPYTTADVEVWPDEEEVAAQSGAAMHAVDSCNSSGEMDMSAAMQTIDTAARAAAIAYAQVGRVAAIRLLVDNMSVHAMTGTPCINFGALSHMQEQGCMHRDPKAFKVLQVELAPAIADNDTHAHFQEVILALNMTSFY